MPRKKKKKTEPEYRLRVFRFQDHERQIDGVAFSIETLKEFVSFEYEVLLEERKENQEIFFKILGLHTPRSVMPAVGPARGVRIFDNLRGTYRIRISKPDGDENVFDLKITKSAVELLQAPEAPYIVFSPEPIPLTL